MFQQEVMYKVSRQCPQTTTFLKRKESRRGIEPMPFRLPACKALPLGQTGSHQCACSGPWPFNLFFFFFFVVPSLFDWPKVLWPKVLKICALGPPRIVQELCESRGGRPGLSVLTSLLVSVDVKNYWTVLRHWSQLVPNMSTDIWGHYASTHHHHPPRPEFRSCVKVEVAILGFPS